MTGNKRRLHEQKRTSLLKDMLPALPKRRALIREMSTAIRANSQRELAAWEVMKAIHQLHLGPKVML